MRSRVLNQLKIARAARVIDQNPRTVVFVTPLLRARELKMASALRSIGWAVILLYKQTTPITPDDNFDITIRASTDEDLHKAAKQMRPRICHVFSGAVDELLLLFCRDKPGRVVIDLNDVFCPSMFKYLQERFEPTRECLSRADGVCARDLQPKFAERYDGFRLPRHTLLFPEYTWRDGTADGRATKKADDDEVRVVSVGTITLEKRGWYESGLLKLAQMLADQKIHLHIYPHWFYRNVPGSVFNFNFNEDFADFIELQAKTPYLHLHNSLSLEELAIELPQYDFGIVSGGCPEFGQRLDFLSDKYMKACYSGRISDYLDARLPILINREVVFNDWLLRRYGIGVDLAGVLKPGFREELLSIKRSKVWKDRIERAAEKLSLSAHANRLEEFYRDVAGKRSFENFAPPRLIQWAQKMPLIGASFARYERTLAQVSAVQSAKGLKSRIVTYQAERDMFEKRIEQVRSEMRAEIKAEGMAIHEIAGLLNWSTILDDHERMNGFTELVKQIQLCTSNPPGNASAISSAWKLLNRKNLDQLLTDGYDNFKRTIALNYFTFPVQAGDPQISTLESKLLATEVEDCWNRAKNLPDDPKLPLTDQLHYRYLVLLLWSYARRLDTEQILHRLREPAEGNPILVPYGGEQACQDLANSLIEYYSMREHVALHRCRTVLEIGGGYGRSAHVILDIHPNIQYTFVDIPPALFVAQRYLSSIFPDRPIFRVRDFKSYGEVADEISNSSIIFLLPHQVSAMPSKMYDFTLNISSFGEMTKDQIGYYFGEINRVTRSHFYMKQWIQSRNPFDGLVLTENDYPVRPEWQKLYSRTCAIQSDFFESLYRVAGDK